MGGSYEDVDGQQVYVEEHGQGQPLVLHGGFGSAASWEPQVAGLAQF